MKKSFACALILCAIFFAACKKTGTDLFSEETGRAAAAELNKKIAELREKLEDAETDFERAEIHSQIAGLEADKGDFPACRKSSRAAIKYQPNQFRSHYLLGASYLAAGQADEAIKEFLVSIGLNDSFAPAHFELGNAYYRKKTYREALAEYEKAVAINPRHSMAHNNSGVIKSILGDQAGALQSFESAARVKPDFPQPYKNMGIIYDTYFKDAKSAVVQYKKYLQLRPNSDDRKIVKSWIDTLEARG